jgi:hypothetical protein
MSDPADAGLNLDDKRLIQRFNSLICQVTIFLYMLINSNENNLSLFHRHTKNASTKYSVLIFALITEGGSSMVL